jgi:hypothetical protein
VLSNLYRTILDLLLIYVILLLHSCWQIFRMEINELTYFGLTSQNNVNDKNWQQFRYTSVPRRGKIFDVMVFLFKNFTFVL